jgi:hypothetical protein
MRRSAIRSGSESFRMAYPAFGELMRRENDIYPAESGATMGRLRRHWMLFAGGDGRYAPYFPDGEGRPQAMRQGDGIHLSVAGAERLAMAVVAAIDRA